MSALKVKAGELTRALKAASAVIERRNSIPILSMVRFQPNGEFLEVAGTDLDMEVRAVAPLLEVSKKGDTFCVSPFAILAAVQSLPKDWPVDVELVDSLVRISWQWGEMDLCTLPAEDYPQQFGDLDPVANVNIPERGLGPLAKAATCISTEETRYYLNGVFLDRNADTGKALLVATDGHRLTAAATDWDMPADDCRVIMPRKFVAIWRQLHGRHDHSLHVFKQRSSFIVGADGGGVWIRSKIIEGTFPEWRRVVPKPEGRETVTMSRSAVASAVAAVLRFIKASGGNRSHSGVISVQDGRAHLDARHEHTGALHFDLGAARGPDTWVGINMTYVGEMLKLIGGDEVTFTLNGQGDPVTIAPAQGSDDTFVVMPLRAETPPKRAQKQQARAA